ncbi:dTMP kinase [Williamsia sp. CHRR-6]|uniref:dTMP kinase n=1 Tax=Williamsia sp. CHRR-6 TaxID=2835871 RepID=UPI001BDB49A0|nr:dTMP kinase [Williamsia sp. CHRR-6]MBT0565697.1 dTMP kinase [Williamsia sp. CHRR-6]
MGELIAVEGLDGAGKRTLVDALTRRWQARGARVSTLAFPRYGQSIHADIAAEALRGGHGDLTDSVYAMAMLFALDRRAAIGAIESALTGCDVVLLDRYVASNAAYSAARMHQDADGAVTRWVGELEFGRFGLPIPDHHVFVDVSPAVAIDRARARADSDTSRARDAYERDTGLQDRTDGVYRQLAQANWYSPWVLLDTASAIDVADRLLG